MYAIIYPNKHHCIFSQFTHIKLNRKKKKGKEKTLVLQYLNSFGCVKKH